MEEGKAPRVTTEAAIQLAKLHPPRNTRAFGRGEVVRHLVDQPLPELPDPEHKDRQFPGYVINWSVFQIRGGNAFLMPDPFRNYIQEVRNHLMSHHKDN